MAPRVLVVDNYDSFVYNLVQEMGELGAELEVRRNDEVDVAGVEELAPDGIVISPGPGRPADAGVSMEVIRRLGGSVPILGVCLGHQCIGEVFGGRVVHAPDIMHGKTSAVHHQGAGVLAGLPTPFTATRYHSLVVDDLPDELEVTAATADGVVMAVRHRTLPIEGVQFHPESILTTEGPRLLGNFLALL
ncbi:MAG TPA: aminodeoxychorismate/anthranilate synthase component II [Acidimicrobiales bacterium]|nr:aminodeoxychorismate/anthranilate synthase component II [Acidimicrobiales bacterium]